MEIYHNVDVVGLRDQKYWVSIEALQVLRALRTLEGILESFCLGPRANPDSEGPSTKYFRTLAPNTIPLMAFGTRVLKYWVLLG